MTRLEPVLYFAFPDGALHYVCSECNALCCRNGRCFSASAAGELGALLRLYPSLESMAVRRSKNEVHFPIPRGGCVLLEPDNLCGIEKHHGRALKPSGCRLFPFNVFSAVGKAVAVRPNFLCPLRLVVPPRPGEVAGTHSLLEGAVREGAIEPDGRGSRASLEREVAFRDLCSDALGERLFSETVLRASEAPVRLSVHVERAARLFGGSLPEPPTDRDEVDDVLLALAPALRLELVELSPEGTLAALALGERLLRRAFLACRAQPSLQSAWDVLDSLGPALRLLGRGDEALRLSAGSAKRAPAFGDAEMVFAGYRVAHEAASGASTLDLLESAMEPLKSATDRSVFLVQMGVHLQQPRQRPRRP